MEKTEQIAILNDRARQAMGIACQLFCTEGISAMSEADQSAVRQCVETYNAFSPDNDPHGERDFGTIYQLADGRWTGEPQARRPDGSDPVTRRIFWKIDYYSHDLKHGSEAPEDAARTQRILTIMLAHEY